MKKKIISLLSLTLCVVLISNCGGGNSTPNPNAGFKIFTYAIAPTNGLRYPSSANVQGILLSSSPNATGTVTNFNVDTVGGAFGSVITGAKVPGVWRMSTGPGFTGTSLCLTRVFYELNVSLNSNVTLDCPGRLIGFASLPDAIDVQAPPASVTMMGEGIDNTYGMPTVAFYDYSGNVAASASVNELVEGKHGFSGVSVNVPQLNLAYDGIYTVVIHNINSDGTWNAVGATSMTVFGNPPPPPGGGGNGGEDCPPPDPNTPQLPCEMQQQ